MQRAKEKAKASLSRVHHHPAGWPLLLFCTLITVALTVLYYGLHNHSRRLTVQPNENFIVLLSVDGKRRTLPTNADTVDELLKKLSIKLGPNDRVEPDRTERIRQDKFRVNIYRAAPIRVIDGDAWHVANTAAATPRAMVMSSGITLYPEDTIALKLPDSLLRGKALGYTAVVTRATAVNVALYGAPATLMRTQSKTVGDFIKEKKITITSADTVKPAASTPITAQMQVQVIRNGVHTITVDEAVAPPVQTVADSSLSLGATAVRQPGSPGKKTTTYEINVQNGEEVSRKVIQSVTVVEPVPQIVARGSAVYVAPDKTSAMAAAGISPEDYGAVDYIVSHEGGWCPVRWQGDRGCIDHGSASASGGYGMFQATPGGKMVSAGADWLTNPVTQIRWATGYAVGRYGSWQGAYNFWVTNHWW